MGRPLSVYRFKVELEDIDGHGEVWRTIDVQGTQTLHHLHRAIQSAFDWDDDHLYSFYLSGRHWDKSSEYVGPNHPQDRFSVIIGRSQHRKTHETSLDSLGLAPGRAIAYLYDYGDEWRHNAVLLDVREPESGASYPRVIERHGEAPKQYPDLDEPEEEVHPLDKADILRELGALAPLAEKISAVCELGREPRTSDELREQCSMALELAKAIRPDDWKRFNLFSAATDQRLQFWLMTLPEILAEKGLFEEAARLCAAWAELMQAEHFLSERAMALAQAGRSKEAREQLSCSLERFPKDSETISRAGDAYRLLKDYADAESCYRRFLEVIDDQRDYERGVARLISLLKEAGKTADAQVLEGERLKRQDAARGTVERATPKVGRNDPCPCGSGKKHKKCCGSGV